MTRHADDDAHSSYIHGVERDAQQRADARRRADGDGESTLVEFRDGDALNLPLRDDEWGSFDIAHARFLLEHIPDPVRVVRQMARAVRPGGRVVLADDDHSILRLSPDCPEFDEAWGAYIRAYDALGNDPYVGRRLTTLLHEARAAPVRNTLVFFGACAGDEAFPSYIENMVGVVRTGRRTVIDKGYMTAERFEEALQRTRVWAQQPDAALWYGVCWAEGRTPSS